MTSSIHGIPEKRRKALQLAALQFMHQQTPGTKSDTALCSSAIAHLVNDHCASYRTAEIATIAAYGELRCNTGSYVIDHTMSTNDVVVLRERKTGVFYAVPVEHVGERCIDPQLTRQPKLSLVKSH